MIAPLRRRHRWTFVGLAIALPTLVVASLLQRPAYDLSATTQPDAPPIPPSSTVLEVLFDDPPSRAHLWQEGRQAVLAVETLGATRQPDLLLYWSATSADVDAPATGLPSEAILLGTLPSHSLRLYALPEPTAGGHVLLYSLAHQKLTAVAELASLPTPQGDPDEGELADEATPTTTQAPDPSNSQVQR